MHYIALGDSISIDDYPAAETGQWGIGAASLFARDVQEMYPGAQFTNLTADGATTYDVLDRQLPRIQPSEDEAIVTVTAGGNDMLMHLGARNPPPNLADSIIGRVKSIVRTVGMRLPNARILLGTVYDPSDGTNVLDGQRFDREAEWLARFNDAVRKMADGKRVVLADIHAHFLGHGTTAKMEDRWYWSGLIFEPSAKGAAEVRELWVKALSEKPNA